MGAHRSAMQRAADADRITKRILKSLRREPITVSEVCDEFKCSRHTLRQDLTLWLESRGMENEIDRESILNWRDSNVASPRSGRRMSMRPWPCGKTTPRT